MRNFFRRVLYPALRLALLWVGLPLALALFLASRAQPQFKPVNEPLSDETKALIASTEHYGRTENTSYLSYSEWFLVFNPQDYARVLAKQPAHEFAYFRSIAQFWYGYGQVFGLTQRAYPFNFGDHLMLVVIGGSTTVEYLIKGVYEGTVGRAFGWAAGARVPEEDYAAKVAYDYGAFIPTLPWFEFDFGKALTGLWTDTPFFGPHFLRKLERKAFLSLEYAAKWAYAGVIGAASHAVYGVADTRVYATLRSLPVEALKDPEVKRIQTLKDGSVLITVPHYQGFTDTVPKLAELGVDFVEVAGNDEILMTLVAPQAWNYDLNAGAELFSLDCLDGSGLKRVAVQAPIRSLGAMLRQLKAQNLQLEHLYDY